MLGTVGRHAALAFALLLLLRWPAAAQEAVVVRIETGAHLQRVENLFMDATRDLLVSTSTDGTVRFWGIGDGALRRTLLVVPPGQGKVQKAGLSRSGDLLAVGVSGRTGRHSESLHLYDLSTDAPPRVIPLPDQVTAVAFAHGGSTIAVATWDRIMVLTLPDLRLVFEDAFDDVVWALDYSGTGQLAAGSFKGAIRIYGSDFRIVGAGSTDIGDEITDLRFSPDGTRLAVGFNSGGGNEVLGVPGLDRVAEFAWPADRPDMTSFHRVGWASDGGTVFSSASGDEGYAGASSRFAIFAWSAAPDSMVRQVLRAVGSMLNFVVVPTGSSASAFGVSLWDGTVYLAEQGVVRWRSPVTKASFDQGHTRSLLVSDDGTRIAFEAPSMQRSFRLDLVAGELTAGDAVAGLSRPILSSPAVTIQDPLSKDGIRINGNQPPLDRWETVSAWAISHDDGAIVLATRFKVRCLAADGSLLWDLSPGLETWLVNVTKDGRYVVAAMGDGTVRWFDLRTGAHRFSVFVHADLRRWILWTEDGHFMGPEPAWQMLRFHSAGARLPWSEDQADLKRALYSPGLIRDILGRTN